MQLAQLQQSTAADIEMGQCRRRRALFLHVVEEASEDSLQLLPFRVTHRM
jgi:hypothetical protein